LIVRKNKGGYIVLASSGFATIKTSARQLGLTLPRIVLPDDAQVVQDHVEVLFQPDPRFKKTVRCQARIENTVDGSGKSSAVILAQVITANLFLRLLSFIVRTTY
jgi:hypothetical protein